MPAQYIREIKPGDQVKATFFLHKMSLTPFRDPSRGSYLSLTLSDKTGQVQGRVWERAEEIARSISEQSVVLVTGVAEDYQGQKQLRLTDVKPEPHQSPAMWADFVPVTQADLRKLKAQLQQVLLGLEREPLVRLARAVFDQPALYELYTAAPAAKQVHHAYVGGLLEHSLEVVAFCDLSARLYPGLDRELLALAALLHDVGKIWEYEVGGAIDLSDRGRLIGHTVLGLRFIQETIASLPGFPDDLADHFAHLILSHHGEYLTGATVLPQTPEAMALHLADLSSGRLRQFDQILAGTGSGEWSAYDRLLNRSLYAGFRGRGEPGRGGVSDGAVDE